MRPCIKFGCTLFYGHKGPHAHDEVRTYAAPDPAFRALRDERQTLVLSRMGADIAAHLFPDDPEVREDQARITAALDAWDAQHAEEWNQVKPWYEMRLPR